MTAVHQEAVCRRPGRAEDCGDRPGPRTWRLRRCVEGGLPWRNPSRTWPRTEQLAVELELRPHVLLIDLREVTFCSSDGISALVRAHEAARAAAVPYAIVTGRVAVLRPLRMLALDRVLQVHRDLSDAKAWLGIVSRLRS